MNYYQHYNVVFLLIVQPKDIRSSISYMKSSSYEE